MHSLANLQDLIPTLAGIIISSTLESAFHLCIYGCTYPTGVANLLLVSLLFIAIPTPFLNFNFYLFLVCLFFIVQ